MAKPEWGTKRTCPNCETRFYDLRRSQIHCPMCNNPVEAEASPRLQRQAPTRKTVKPAAAIIAVAEEIDMDLPELEEAEDILTNVDEDDEPEAEEDEDDLRGEEDEDEDEDTLIEDASDLGVDDDDMAEVMEHLEDDRDV